MTAIVVYLNGTEIVRDDLIRSAAIGSPTPSSNAGDDGQNLIPFADLPLNLLNAGTNTLAVEIHQMGADSSDVSFDCRLTATRTTGGTSILLPAGVATVRARVLDGSGTWSALNEQEFLVNTSAASAANLVVSEIMYHPADPAAANCQPDSSTRRVRMDRAAEYRCPAGGPARCVLLQRDRFHLPHDFQSDDPGAGGGRIILCENILAFRQRYGTGLNALIAGQFAGSLDNAGERISLKQPDSTVIVDFTYTDTAPWPVDADGIGRSLVLTYPVGSPDPALSSSWRPSVWWGGSPTGSDATTYAAWKTANGISSDTDDTDKDGLNSFTEYLHGTSPVVPDVTPQLEGVVGTYPIGVPPVPGRYLTFSWQRNLAAGDVNYVIEQSTSLAGNSWTTVPVTMVSETVLPLPASGSTSLVTCRSNASFDSLGKRYFFRLRATQR